MKTAAEPESQALADLEHARFSRRLRERDSTLWKPRDPGHQKLIRNALGWVRLPETMAASLGGIRAFAQEVRSAGFTRAVVLGMGGSSLCCRVFAECFSPRDGFPALEVLDSTHPDDVRDLESRLDLSKTLFIAASKSGSTIEPNCMVEYFWEKSARCGGKTGARFAAVTDPGSSLEKTARRLGWSKVFLNPADVGGRFSVLSHFGLVPAAVMGVDIARLLASARDLLGSRDGDALGARLAAWARKGRDKLALRPAPSSRSFGLWIEQLVAESTGKEGRGILPFLAEPSGAAEGGAHCVSIDIPELSSPEALGREFMAWEIATAAAGFLLEVDPFDQPDVQSAKDRTLEVLKGAVKGRLPPEKPSFQAGSMAAFSDAALAKKMKEDSVPLEKALAAHLKRAKPEDFIAVLAYARESPENVRALSDLRLQLAAAAPRKVPVVLSFGPRYLHSTGQLHKGGPDTGLFLQLAETDVAELPIPGRPYGFKVLHQAQARGDFAALIQAGRRALRLDLGLKGAGGLRAVANALA